VKGGIHQLLLLTAAHRLTSTATQHRPWVFLLLFTVDAGERHVFSVSINVQEL